ncbi:hypothetical protein [Synechococcus sp. MIT S9503]|uniref:hypothetical protein n=1 Tax=Synechococcus sp. MIT S9503 TaxID=3082547 RepID=UPI0039A4D474
MPEQHSLEAAHQPEEVYCKWLYYRIQTGVIQKIDKCTDTVIDINNCQHSSKDRDYEKDFHCQQGAPFCSQPETKHQFSTRERQSSTDPS